MRFAKNVWNVCPEGKTDEQVALEGLNALEGWMKEIGVAMNAAEVGVTPENIGQVADATILGGGFMQLTRDDIVEILRRAL